MRSIDTDRNGKINYNEFLTSCVDESAISNEKYLHYVFNSFDLNRDGSIQREEFNAILRAYSKDFKCNEQLVEQLIQENDQNRDGVIDFGEFRNSLKTIRHYGGPNSLLCESEPFLNE